MAVEGTTVQIQGFDELQKKLTITLPKVIRQMAFTTDASAATLARKEEQQGANRLHMGEPQHKGARSGFNVYSKWDAKSGWVSSDRSTKDGNPWRMSHFGWARGTKSRKGSVIAEYGSSLANLWAHPSKPYSATSPQVGRRGRLTRWKVGQSRPAMYNWSVTAGIIDSMADAAIAKTEAQFADKFKRM